MNGARPSTRAALLALALVAAPVGRPVTAAALPAAAGGGESRASAMAWIPAGSYQPLYRPEPADSSAGRAAPRVAVPGFWLGEHAVTNAEYLAFVTARPEWRRSRAGRLYVDENYLRHWKGDLAIGDPRLDASPVVNVSWFAARAYCAWRGHALPTVDQWEYAASASERRTDATRDPAFLDRLREWYVKPAPERLPNVRSTFRDVYGVWDLHGLVWEWTDDFSSALVTGESRGDVALDRSLYCGASAANAADFRDYAAFMRYAFRSSLAARYCVANLGFREAAPGPANAGGAGRTAR